jgi:hypothetical protein
VIYERRWVVDVDRELITTGEVRLWADALRKVGPDLYRQYLIGRVLLKRHGRDLPIETYAIVKPLLHANVPMSEIRVRGDLNGLWRAYRVICVHHGDTPILLLVAGDKNNRSDWYAAAMATTERL